MPCLFCFLSSKCRLLNVGCLCLLCSSGMECFLCFRIEKKEKSSRKEHRRDGQCTNLASNPFRRAPSDKVQSKASYVSKQEPQDRNAHIAARMFTFRDLATATKNFKPECLVGEGGFGRVYKGRLGSGKIVAVKQLDRNGVQGSREFLVEVLMLSLLHHPNLVSLIGYCADGDQRLLVYEFLPLGSLEDHLHDLPIEKEPLCWNTRMKIAAGAARGLEYLHDKASPPVIYRDLKSSNILLDEGYHPKLSDFGLAKLGPVGDNTHVSTRVMGTYGYCAPEYATTGQLTLKSDVYSFGVVLLELITGRRAIDNARPSGEHNLVAWARPLFKDRRKLASMADPLLQGSFPMRGLFQALAVAAMCLQEQAATRPLIADVVNALTYLASQFYDPAIQSVNSSMASTTHSQGRGEKGKNHFGGSSERDQTVQGNNLRGTQSLSHHSLSSVCNKTSCVGRVNDVVSLDKDIPGGSAEREDASDSDRFGRNHNHERANPFLTVGKKMSTSCRERRHALTEARPWGDMCTDRRRWIVGIQKEQV